MSTPSETSPPVRDQVAAREVVLSDLRAHLQLIALTVDTGTEHGQGKAAALDDLLVALNDLPSRTITPEQRDRAMTEIQHYAGKWSFAMGGVDRVWPDLAQATEHVLAALGLAIASGEATS